MPKIQEIIGDGPELANSQRAVLELLDKHPDYLFRMHPDDLNDLQRWLLKPDSDEVPPNPIPIREGEGYSVSTVRWPAARGDTLPPADCMIRRDRHPSGLTALLNRPR